MRVYLVGYMGAGKSRFGRLIAEATNMEFIDLDELFEMKFRIRIADFFDKYDEQAFRRIERSLLEETTKIDNLVVSTGGGTPCYFQNMELIKKSGFSIYLSWTSSDLAQRLYKARRNRPLLLNVPEDQLEKRVETHLEEREQYYKQADLTVLPGNLTQDQCLDEILKFISL
jgi:shikimate kinase